MLNTIKTLYNKYRNLINYCIIGCSGALLDFLLYSLLISIFKMHYLIANIISVTLGITNNFFLNAFLNFKVTDNIGKRFVSFYMVGMLGLIISESLLYMLIDMFNINSIIAKILTIFVITVIQYILNKTVTFKKGENR